MGLGTLVATFATGEKMKLAKTKIFFLEISYVKPKLSRKLENDTLASNRQNIAGTERRNMRSRSKVFDCLRFYDSEYLFFAMRLDTL